MYLQWLALAGLVNSVVMCTAQNLTQQQLANAKRTLNVGVILFPGFEPLDVYGPLGILYESSGWYKISLHTIGHTKGPVSTRIPPHAMEPGGPIQDYGYSLSAAAEVTSTFLDAPPLDVILIPGGLGNMALVQANDTSIEDFIARRAQQADYILSICTGAVHLARSGLLNNEPATTNKALYNWVTTQGLTYKGANVKWQPSARWVEAADGKIWTSSGVSAGIDMTYAWLRKIYGDTDAVQFVMNAIEYAPHTDASWDPFSVVHKVPGADTNHDLEGCVTPVGFS